MPESETKGITLREIIAPFEAEVLAKVETLYPDEGERAIVMEILIPQFRKILAGVIPEGIVLPGNLPAVCEALDRVIEENKGLLDTEGLFRLLLKEVTKVREQIAQAVQENFLESAREGLRAHGITDRTTLLHFGTKNFESADFPPYGKGVNFAKLILGRTIGRISKEILEEIAEKFHFEPTSEETKKKYIEILAAHGITDRSTLLRFRKQFAVTDFPPYGKGSAFASKVLGRIIKNKTIDILEEIADAVGFSKESEKEKLQRYRAILATFGIIDRATLFNFGVAQFGTTRFLPHGEGRTFAGIILEKTGQEPSKEILEEIAEKLGLEPTSEETKAQYRKALAAHGINDRMTLLRFRKQFSAADFPPFGKGKALAYIVIGRRVRNITIEILEEIADIVGFCRESEEETKKRYTDALAVQGICSRKTLLRFGVDDFTTADFLPFGKGKAFATKLLGRRVKDISTTILEEISDVVGFEKESEEARLPGIGSDVMTEYRGKTLKEIIAYFSEGILEKIDELYPDEGERRIATEILIPQFRSCLSKIIPEGVVLPRDLSAICEALDRAIVENKELLDTEGLFQPLLKEIEQVRTKISAAVQENFLISAKEALKIHGIIDSATLFLFGSKRFAHSDFPPYGKGVAFAGKILGSTIKFSSVEVLEEIAYALGFARNELASLSWKFRKRKRHMTPRPMHYIPELPVEVLMNNVYVV